MTLVDNLFRGRWQLLDLHTSILDPGAARRAAINLSFAGNVARFFLSATSIPDKSMNAGLQPLGLSSL